MASRQARWAKRWHAALVTELGGRCVAEDCSVPGGAREGDVWPASEDGKLQAKPVMLTIDHVDGRAWVVERVGWAQRVRLYWREYRAGVALRVLCMRCNARVGGGLRYAAKVEAELEEVPF